MKKLLLVAVALVFTFGLIADVAVADERVSLKGQMRVRAWAKDNLDDFDDDNAADEDQYIDQRMRVQTTIKAAEGVKAVIRTDFSEGTWGLGWASHRYKAGTNAQFQVDRAYMDITKGIVNLKAGQHYMGLGALQVVDNNATGVTLTINPKPVSVKFMYTKEDEGGDRNDEEGNEDVDSLALNVGVKNDGFKADIFGAMIMDDTAAEDEPFVVGINAWANMGAAKVGGELAFFGGDKGATTDYTGTQLWLNAEAKLSDMVKLGADFVYSTGSDDANEEKITYLGPTNFGDFNLEDRGPFNTFFATFGVDTVFDPTGEGAGAIGAGAYGEISVSEALTLYAQLMYLTTDEDDVADVDVLLGNLGLAYKIMSKTTLAAQYHYVSPDADGEDLDAGMGLGVMLKIGF